MTMLLRSLACLGLLLAVTAPALAGPTRPVVVFAGSAAQPPLEVAAAAFQAKTGTPVILHLGGSGAMLNQIRLTGLGDLYIPGSPDYMEKARVLDLIEDAEFTIAYLIPAILVAKGNPLGISGLQDLERPGLRIGIADPNGVCVGLYAVEILEANHLTHKVRPNLRGMVESCAKAASMIPLNQVDVVLGWREFAAWQPDAMETIPIDAGAVPRLAYIPAAVLRHAQNRPGAMAFAAYLKSAEGQAFFHKWGYLTDEKVARELAPRARIGGTYTLPEDW